MNLLYPYSPVILGQMQLFLTQSWISSNLNVNSLDMMAFVLMDSMLRNIDKGEMSVLVFFSLLRISQIPMQNNLLIYWCDFAQASTVR